MSENGYLHKAGETFGKSPYELLVDATITDGAARCYAYMHWRYGSNHDNHEGRKSIAEALTKKTRTITNYTAELEQADWIVILPRIDRNGQHSNFYHVFETQTMCRRWRLDHDKPKPERKVRTRKNRYGKGGRKSEALNPDSRGGGGESGFTGGVNLDSPNPDSDYPDSDFDCSKEQSLQPSVDGWAVNDLAYIFHEDSYLWEQVTIRAAQDGIYTPSGMIRITSSEGKKTSRDPKNVYRDKVLMGDPVSAFTDLQRVIAVKGFGMAPNDIVTETRAKRFNLVVSEIRQTFANNPVTHGELFGAYEWLDMRDESSIPPVDPVAVCNLINRYRSMKKQRAAKMPQTQPVFNPDSFSQ